MNMQYLISMVLILIRFWELVIAMSEIRTLNFSNDIGTDCIFSCKSNYHTTITAPTCHRKMSINIYIYVFMRKVSLFVCFLNVIMIDVWSSPIASCWKYQDFMQSNMKFSNGSLFHLFLKLVYINYIFLANVRTLYLYCAATCYIKIIFFSHWHHRVLNKLHVPLYNKTSTMYIYNVY
jgi:hypothetical protein